MRHLKQQFRKGRYTKGTLASIRKFTHFFDNVTHKTH